MKKMKSGRPAPGHVTNPHVGHAQWISTANAELKNYYDELFGDAHVLLGYEDEKSNDTG